MCKHNGEIICPSCGHPIYGYTAISRKDNKTEICDNCGTLEAINTFQDYIKSKNKKNAQ